MGAAAGVAPGARIPLPDFAASMSRAITRPCGPEPSTRLRSTPASFARRRASGEEKILLAPSARGDGTPPGAAFAAPPSPLRGEGLEVAASAFIPPPLGEGGGEAAGWGTLVAGADFAAPLAAAFTSSPSAA